jgi:hypothetical protein
MAMANGGGDGNSDDDKVTLFGKASRNSGESSAKAIKKMAEKGKYDGDTQVSGINSKSKQVTCYKIKNIVRGCV